MPEWLRRFRYAEWVDEAEKPPPTWHSTQDWPTWHDLRARRRWSDAGRAWLAERGREGDWFALVHPATARNCGIRVTSDAPAPGVVEDPPRRLVVQRDDPPGHASR